MLVRDERDKVLKICYCGSMAEQLTRNEQVVGSIPTSSSRKKSLLSADKGDFFQ